MILLHFGLAGIVIISFIDSAAFYSLLIWLAFDIFRLQPYEASYDIFLKASSAISKMPYASWPSFYRYLICIKILHQNKKAMPSAARTLTSRFKWPANKKTYYHRTTT
jgi:hypothetical protein